MEKKSKLIELASGIGKTARDLLDNAVQSVDQNDDGKFDFEDVSAMAESVGNTVEKGTLAFIESAKEKARLLELKILQPIFTDTLDSVDFSMPKFIRITARDKKYAESEVCKDSIGYLSDQKDLHFITIFRDCFDSFGITLYPDLDDEFYYMDPTDRDRYISIDEYFAYLKVARINELQKIAQDLGAKYFKVTFKEEQSSFTDKNINIHANTPSFFNAKAEQHSSEKKYSTVEIAAEMEFPGHAPIKPELKYMSKDPSIQNLVAMRMDVTSPLKNQKYMLKMSTSSGMKENDAAKIDAILKGLKLSGNTTIASEAKKEARRYLEYEIRF